MTYRNIVLATLVATLGSGLWAMGCGGGSSGGGGGGTAAPGAQQGQITSALPTTTRNANGYTHSTAFVPPNTVTSGFFASLGSANVGSAVFASEAPFGNLFLVDSGTGTIQGALGQEAHHIVNIGSDVYAATGNDLRVPSIPVVGDLYQRDTLTGNFARVVDTDEQEMVVASVVGAINSGVSTNSTWAAFSSVLGSIEIVSDIAPATSSSPFGTVATIPSAAATHAIGFRNELWIGGSENSDVAAGQGGNGKLYRVSNTNPAVTEEIGLPIPLVGGGVRQKVTDMMTISLVQSGSTSGTEFLVVAVGEFDVNGTPLSGSVMIGDGQDFEVMTTYFQDAPLCVAWQDNTIYVGTRAGNLQYRDDNGDFIDEPGLIANSGIYSLLVHPTSGDLFMGAANTNGAVLFLRTGGAAPPPPPPPPQLTYANDIAPIMAGRCAICHNGGTPAAQLVFSLTTPADPAADQTEVLAHADLQNPSQSLILLKGTNDTSVGGHVGGALLTVGQGDYVTIETWLTQGGN